MEQMIAGLEYLDRADLERLKEALDLWLHKVLQESPSLEGAGVRPYADGTLQAEARRYFRKDGSTRE